MTGYEMLPVAPSKPDTGPICGLHFRERAPARRYRVLGPAPTPGRVGFRLYVATRRGGENWMCSECAQRIAVGFEIEEIG